MPRMIVIVDAEVDNYQITRWRYVKTLCLQTSLPKVAVGPHQIPLPAISNEFVTAKISGENRTIESLHQELVRANAAVDPL